MVRPDGTRVYLSAGDWVKIALTNLVAVGSIIVTIWTKQAVIETEIEHLKQAVAKIERTLEPRSSPDRGG